MLNRLDVIFQRTFLFTPVITISLPANVCINIQVGTQSMKEVLSTE